MKEEILLKQKFGNNMPFMVPEGYFDSLEKNLMQNILEAKASQKPLKRSIFMRPLRWVACFAAVLLVSGAIYFNGIKDKSDFNQNDNISENISSSSYSDYMLDEISDCAMFDNDDFYSYVTNE